MNPTVKSGNVFKWKVENINKLDDNGQFSAVFATGNQKWKLQVCRRTSNHTDYLHMYLYFVNEDLNNKSWVCEVDSKLKLLETTMRYKKTHEHALDTLLYTQVHTGWGAQLLSWSEVSFYNESNYFTVQVDFTYKIYDFSRNDLIFTDSVIKVQNVEFHISKGYLCTFSKYFNDKFINSGQTKVTIEGVKYDDFVKVLAALYPNPVALTSGTYDIFADLSEKFEITSLSTKCEQYFKANQCATLVQKIKTCEQTDPNSVPGLIATVKLGKELKMVMQTEEFQHFNGATKFHFLTAAIKFL